MTATEHAGEFFMRLCLSEDGLGYPDRVGVVATDVGDVAKHVWGSLEEGVPIVVIDARGRETLVTPRSMLERLVDRVRQRSCVGVERRDGGRVSRRERIGRRTLERQLLS
jgi:hypothetical protein